MTRFLLVGGATVDFYALTPDIRKVEIPGSRDSLLCLPYGSKTTLPQLHVHPGGSAANSAVALRQLGDGAHLLAAIGGDELGKLLLAGLRFHRIPISETVVLPKAKTGVSIILRSPDGEKTALTFRGANDELASSHLQARRVEQADVLVLTSLPSEKNFALFLKALSLARRFGKQVVFAPSSSMLSARGARLSSLHRQFHLCIMNAEEAERYTGQTNPVRAIHRLPGIIQVITDAGNGAHASVGSTVVSVPAPKVKIIDTTGAGDSFTAGFVHSYYAERRRICGGRECVLSPRERVLAAGHALRFASAVAGIKLSHEGAHFTKGRKEVASFLRAHPELRAKPSW